MYICPNIKLKVGQYSWLAGQQPSKRIYVLYLKLVKLTIELKPLKHFHSEAQNGDRFAYPCYHFDRYHRVSDMSASSNIHQGLKVIFLNFKCLLHYDLSLYICEQCEAKLFILTSSFFRRNAQGLYLVFSLLGQVEKGPTIFRNIQGSRAKSDDQACTHNTLMGRMSTHFSPWD